MAGKEPHRDERSSAARWISPGLVGDNEIVLRTIFDPHHIKSGVLSPAAIALDDLRSRGWSLDRKRFTSLWRMKLSHWNWHRRKTDLLGCFVLPINVKRVRSECRNNDKQILSITDWALCRNPAHAAVLLSAKSGEGEARRARTMLMTVLPRHIEVSRAFSANDRWGWSRGMRGEMCAPVKTIFEIIFRAAGKLRSRSGV